MPEEMPGTITIEVDFSHVPVRPVSAKEIRELEVVLMIASLFRPDVIKGLMDPNEFTTWVDSLAVASGALAREKAGYTVRRIAEELGRTEATIRRHLAGETKAGKIVKETYEMLVRGKIRLVVPGQAGIAPPEEVEKVKKEAEECKAKLDSLAKDLEWVMEEKERLEAKVRELEEAKRKAEEKIAMIKEALEKLVSQL